MQHVRSKGRRAANPKLGRRSLFRASETGARLSATAFAEAKDALRLDLVQLQQAIRLGAEFPVIIVLAGVQGAGAVDTLNMLNTWMDPRWIATHTFEAPSDEERQRPPFWRYWRTLPPAGSIGLYLDGWYGPAMAAHCANGSQAGTSLRRHLDQINAFERTLADNGALIVKIWLHLAKDAPERKTDAHRDDGLFGFRISDNSWPQTVDYDTFVAAGAKVLKATDSASAPWHVVEGADDNHRRATVLGFLRDALKAHRKKRRAKVAAAAKAIKHAKKTDKKHKPRRPKHCVLDTVDLSKRMSDDAYTKAFRVRQAKLYDLHKAARAAGIATVLAFEGWDAAGKGGAIRRLTYALNARNYSVVPIAAPNDEERAHHYLWRFWRHLDRDGRITLFDRSWYGRLLVERVEHLIAEEAWLRAYDEINAFEAALTAHGTVLLKFWLHIDSDKQLERFEEREANPHKQWKITPDDWRNRKRRVHYEHAANDMLRRTSTPKAPWILVPSNDKHYARIMIFDILIKALETALRKKKR